jgi:hypothetical protein
MNGSGMAGDFGRLAKRVAYLEAREAEREAAAKMVQPAPVDATPAGPPPHPVLRAIAAKGDGVFRG